MISEATEDRTPIYAESFFGGFQVDVSIGENPYRQTTFPTGSHYTAVSYDLGMVYISASTPNAEACYRWISELMRHPELFGSMPSRDSYLEDPAYAASQSPETLAAYTRFADLMEQPNTISVASLFRGDFALMIPQRWLNQAFDEYVMRDGDLDAALAEAQAKTDQYLACVATIPPFDPTIQTQQDYTGLFRDCAVSIDPEAEALFPPQ
jgi:ABC-type glycerol-3-phosphate transport system substrate-binding protein